MIYNVMTYKGSNRVQYIDNVMKSLGVSYELHVGNNCKNTCVINHREQCLNVIRKNKDLPYVIIIEDDVLLTNVFDMLKLEEIINSYDRDVILTGVSSYNYHLHNLDGFRGTQFVVIKQSAYDKVLSAKNKGHFEDILSMTHLSKQITLPFFTKQTDQFESNMIDGLYPQKMFDNCEVRMLQDIHIKKDQIIEI